MPKKDDDEGVLAVLSARSDRDNQSTSHVGIASKSVRTRTRPDFGRTSATELPGMETGALQRQRGNAAVLAAACIAMALWSTSCGGGGSTSSVTVSAAGFSVSPTTVTFGNQAVGNTSAAQSATLINVGNATLTLSSIQVTGPNAGDYTLTNNCGSSLPPSAQCTISVTFTPTASGTRTASVSITDDASGSPQAVTLIGTGSAAESFTLSNTGNAILNITSIGFTGTNPGDYSQNTTCGTTVAAGATCTVAVVFTPAAVGSSSATLVVTDSSNNVAGSRQTATLTGTGIHDVILTLTASTSAGIAGYNIYRGTTAGGESTTPLNSTPVNATNYVDANVTPGSTYYYVVTTVASDGVTQSSPSNEASAAVPSP